jgi:hypothetical protein
MVICNAHVELTPAGSFHLTEIIKWLPPDFSNRSSLVRSRSPIALQWRH